MSLMAFPPPVPGEAVTGYFCRLAKENGFNNPKYLFESLFGKQVYRYNRIRKEDFINMTQHSGAMLDNLWLTYDDAFYVFKGVVIPKNHILEKDHRWCPECWKMEPIMKCVWQIGWMPICDVHEKLLLDQCSACGEKIRYKDHVPSCHQCGELLEDMVSTAAPEDVLALQRQHFGAIWEPKNYHHYSQNPTVNFISRLLHDEETNRRTSKQDQRTAPRAHFWLSVAETMAMYQRLLPERQSA